MTSPPTLVLLDSASMYFRAFFGVPNTFHAVDGTPVNAVRGFLDAIARVVNEFHPDQLVACWDNDWRPQFRVDLVPSYKAHRVAAPPASDGGHWVEQVPDDLQRQEPVMIAALEAFGIARVGVDGFEADDVIAQFARDHHGPVDIVSGDRDLFQLVRDDQPIRIAYTAKGMGNLQLVTDEWLQAKYGVTGRRYADLAILRGDASDGLPGVAGVGEKTAASLIERFDDLDGIMTAASDPAVAIAAGLRSKLLAAAEYIRVADPAVRLTHPVPVPTIDPTIPDEPADAAAVVALADAYNLDAPSNRLLNAITRNH